MIQKHCLTIWIIYLSKHTNCVCRNLKNLSICISTIKNVLKLYALFTQMLRVFL